MKKIHLICNAHIDPIWQWEWEEGASATLSTFQSAANLMKEYDYVFCHNEVNLYKYTKRFAPALFDEIKKLADEGKWKIMGGWYLQPDCLMPGGEGIVRQLQEGKIYFTENFGYMPKTAVNFDPFGHSRGIVQILDKCGQKNYLFMRPSQSQMPLECDQFIWRGYDDSTVKGYRVNAYASTLGKALEKIRWDIDAKKSEDVIGSTWGVGNHGGGPSRKDLKDIEEFISNNKDIEIIHSDPDSFFEEINPTYEYSNSLIPCMAGCYTSMASLKQRYRRLENQLYFTEKIASIASLKGVMEYPSGKFEEVTEDMLNIQFHDILPGDMILEGEENGLNYANHGLQILNQIRADAFFGLVKGEEIAKEGTFPILAFNPKTYDGEQYIECEMSILRDDGHYDDGLFSILRIYDQNGAEVPSQTIKESSNLTLDWRKKVIFKADLSPLSINRFTAVSEAVPLRKMPHGEDVIVDNGEMHAEISSKTGLISKLVMKGHDISTQDFMRPYMYDDNEDPWGMLHANVGWDPKPFNKMENPDGPFTGLKSFEVIEDGDIYVSCESFFEHGLTRIRMGYKAYKKEGRIDIDVNVFPSEPSKVIKLHLPIKTEELIGEQIFGMEPLFMDGRECISHDFLAIKDGDEYIEIIKPSNYASSYKDGILALTLIKTATYCAHPISDKRPIIKENMFIGKVDQGQRDFHFSITAAKKEELKKNADLFVERPYALNIFPTIDEKTDNGFQIHSSNPNISFVTIKKSIQAPGYIIRLQNCSDSEIDYNVDFGGASIDIHFGKFEVKTLNYDGGAIKEIKEMLI